MEIRNTEVENAKAKLWNVLWHDRHDELCQALQDLDNAIRRFNAARRAPVKIKRMKVKINNHKRKAKA